jgi:hypothetical protein
MTIKYLVIGAIIVTLLGSSQIAEASTGFRGDDFTTSKSQRPPINPEFNPDFADSGIEYERQEDNCQRSLDN